MKRLPLAVIPLALIAAIAIPAAAQDDELTLELCAACHEAEAESFAAGPHGLAMAARGAEVLEASCAACHEPTAEHPEDPGTGNVNRMPGDAACATCHGDVASRLALAAPAHQRHAIACLDCHASGHEMPADSGVETPYMLHEAPVALCGSCHPSQKAATNRPFTHRQATSDFSCLNCHSLHSFERAGRLALSGATGVCVECHTGQAGPYVFPHPPREIDGCVACHEPHGSTNPRLLKRQTILPLCLECHTNVPAFHDLSQARFRVCQSCHVAVHGSNRDPRLFDE